MIYYCTVYTIIILLSFVYIQLIVYTFIIKSANYRFTDVRLVDFSL